MRSVDPVCHSATAKESSHYRKLDAREQTRLEAFSLTTYFVGGGNCFYIRVSDCVCTNLQSEAIQLKQTGLPLW